LSSDDFMISTPPALGRAAVLCVTGAGFTEPTRGETGALCPAADKHNAALSHAAASGSRIVPSFV
jgi:hypothetical protein